MLRDPFDFRSSLREMDALRREMNRLFDTWDGWPRVRTPSDYPAMNVWANEDGVIVSAELPGIEPDDPDTSVQGNLLRLSGHRAAEAADEESVYHRRGRAPGNFPRPFRLPFEVDADAVEATYEKGVLSITLPRAEEDKPRKITVKAE